ncbi:hypothetical protein [Streptomyces sp. NPDC059063]|uniref:hypothetical protein n=1 Tax=unclassified Streptomyces TaxID=2593676 RepID=UPI0036B58B59
MSRDRGGTTGRVEAGLDVLLRAAHRRVGIAVHDRLMGQGGPPELRDPDLALDRLLASAHRRTGFAVTERLAREACAAGEPRATRGRLPPAGNALMRRPAAVRLKYRFEALGIARALARVDPVESLGAALRDACLLSEMLAADEARAVTGRIAARFAEVQLLPKPRRRPSPVIGTDYLAAVEEFLAPHTEQLAGAVRDVWRLLDEELAPCLADGDGTWSGSALGADVVAQDLVDDLTVAHGLAVALSRAVQDVERACSDFVGADLRDAKLDGVLLKGIRWDAATTWPEEWEALVRRASLPVGGERGVLVVAAEPHDSVVSADV